MTAHWGAWRARRAARVPRFPALFCAALLVASATAPQAQDRPGAGAPDPRVALKAGFRDAGQAAWHMELVATLPRPNGFFDPAAPGGAPAPPERPDDAPEREESGVAATGQAAAAGGQATPPTPPRTDLNFANSDIAFSGDRMFVGNFNGFNVYDIENPRKPQLRGLRGLPRRPGRHVGPRHLLFMSVEQTRGRVDCGTQGVQGTVSAERFRGVRIFDISDVRKPRQIAAVQTCRGSHTHTLVVDPKDAANVYIYGSGTGAVRSGARSSPAARARIRRRIRTPRSSAST